jgi:hypothetical protein
MNAVPARFETNTSVNERFVAYLDRQYAPRDSRGWYLMMGLTVGSLLATAMVTVFLFSSILLAWPIIPFGLALAGWGILELRKMKKARDCFQDLRRVVQNGVPVTGYVIQAHASLLEPGERTPLPCLILFTFQPEVDGDQEYMRYLADRIFSLKGKSFEDADRRFLAGLTSEDYNVPYRRRRLPNSFTDGSTIYCADLWVQPAHLKDNALTTNILPCLAEMGEYGGIDL